MLSSGVKKRGNPEDLESERETESDFSSEEIEKGNENAQAAKVEYQRTPYLDTEP